MKFIQSALVRPLAMLLLIGFIRSTFGQTILYENYQNIGGGTVAALTNAPNFPYNPSASYETNLFEAPSNIAESFGTRMRGYVHPPVSGNYTFWIASDDQGALYLSTDDTPANRALIANVVSWTGPRVWDEPRDNNYLFQKSQPIFLQAGQTYYIEALSAEGGGGDNLAVGWQLPDLTLERPIPGNRLTPYVASTNPPSIVAQPASLAVSEDSQASFRVIAAGAEPFTYQWQRSGTNITEATNQTHVFFASLADDGISFRCIVANTLGAATSQVATVTVTLDTNAPVITFINPTPGATLNYFFEVSVTFSERVTGVDADDLLINGQPTTNVTGQAAGPYVFRFFPAGQSGPLFLSFATNHDIRDLSGNANAFAGSNWTYTLDLSAPSGIVLREYFLNVSGGSIASLLSSADYPNNPSGTSYENIFEAPSNWADNYGTRMRGYVHAPVTGDYTFWIATDDQGELYLSTDDTPANKSLIASVPTWVGVREWDSTRDPANAVQRSAPQHLESGRKYYIEALQVEGGGGDNIAVGWQLPDGTYERPIPGNRLSHWQNSTNPPSITTEPADVSITERETAAFQVSANGAEPLRFKWWRNGVPLDGENRATFLRENVSTNDSGDTFFCIVTNYQGSVTSRVATLTVLPEMVPPVISRLLPAAGATARQHSQMEVTFSEPVSGIGAADLLINGQSATNVLGLLAGPYVFQFITPPVGEVIFSWAAGHGITDRASIPNAFAGGSWTNVFDPNAVPGDLIINEVVAANETGLTDEDGEPQDWIEIYNRGTNAVNLDGWSLSDDARDIGQWVFPARVIPPGGFLVVFASAKNRVPAGTNALHANFKLSSSGEYLGLFSPESPRVPVSELSPRFPEQRNDYSYGLDASNAWRYFSTPTPGAPNGSGMITGVVEPVHFSVGRGFFAAPFNVLLTTPTPGATIRYTTNGSPPTELTGLVYTNVLRITATTTLRAAAFKTNLLPSTIRTHTYLYNLSAAQRMLPVLSIVTDQNNLTGPSGILGIGPGYHNPSQHGIQWERPVSFELIHPQDNSGTQIDCGLRVGGGDYIRPLYQPDSKFSFHVYFRGDYGPGRLDYPFFTNSVIQSYNQLVLRAGMNDPVNPFLRDEFARRLLTDVGQVSSHGTFMHLFINGLYKGYYNPTERVDEHFCHDWHGGGEDWDVLKVGSVPQDGDATEWNKMRNYVASHDPNAPDDYAEMARGLDLVNFIDYLLVNIVGGTGDWGWNNWRSARDRAPNSPFRYYIWDAEWAWGYGRPVTHNNFTGEIAAGTEMGNLYQQLKVGDEFRLLFADRIQKHLFNKGALADASLLARYNELKGMIAPVISGFDDSIGTVWIPGRRANILQHFATERLDAFTNAPVFSLHGGRVPAGFNLSLTNTAGAIYYTTDGSDPRVMFTGAVAAEARRYTNGFPVRLDQGTLVKARSLVNGTNWSAITQAEFVIGRLGLPLRITELMYNPVGGDAYEFIELQNTGATTLDLSGISLQGVGFVFPQGATLAAGATLVLSSSANTTAFATRYPFTTVFGTYTGSLANGGERIALLDRLGNTILSVDYDDDNGWPKSADGRGDSLEIIDPNADPDDPLNWRASFVAGGTPGVVTSPAPPLIPDVRLNEILALNVAALASGTNYPDWIELFNASTQTVSLAGWSLTDDGNERKFVFPPTTEIAGGAFLLVWCDSDTNAPGLHAGFALNQDGETIALFDAQTNRLDALTFGLQIADFSVGPIDGQWQLNTPTPAATNTAAALGSITNLAINEWMANPLAGGDDWLELFNKDTNRPLALRGLYFGTVTNAVHQIRSLSFITPRGFALFQCDEKPGANHLDLKLPAAGSPLVLYDETGVIFHSVVNTNQTEGVSRGRSPDGIAAIVNFPGRATPGGPNAPTSYPGPVINEVMARNATTVTNAAGRVVDWFELYNPRTTNFPIGGMSLSVDASQPGQWPVPAGVVLPPLSYLVIWCDNESPPSLANGPLLNTGRSLADHSGGVYLFDQAGQLKDSVEYGFQVTNLTIGKNGGVWRLCANPTPGAANSAAASLGSQANLRINEWMANPLSGDDWFELYNSNSLPVSLSGLYLTDDPSLSGQAKFAANALSFIGARSWIKIEADGDAAKGRHHVNFSLDGDGETLRLYLSTTLLDSVDFGLQLPGVSQGRLADGSNNIVAFPTTPTPGSMNLADTDGDGLPDVWESANGLNPLLGTDANGDADHDGVSNRDEYLTGTDPQSAQSYLKIDARNAAAGTVTLGFNAVAGKSYSVLYHDLATGTNWPKLKDISPPATTRRVEIIDATTGGATRFYRLVTPKR